MCGPSRRKQKKRRQISTPRPHRHWPPRPPPALRPNRLCTAWAGIGENIPSEPRVLPPSAHLAPACGPPRVERAPALPAGLTALGACPSHLEDCFSSQAKTRRVWALGGSFLHASKLSFPLGRVSPRHLQPLALPFPDPPAACSSHPGAMTRARQMLRSE